MAMTALLIPCPVMSEEVKDRFVWWYEKIIPALVVAMLGLAIYIFNKNGEGTERKIEGMQLSLGADIAEVKEKITQGQVQTSGIVLQQGWLSDRVSEIRQTQIKLEERIRALEQSP